MIKDYITTVVQCLLGVCVCLKESLTSTPGPINLYLLFLLKTNTDSFTFFVSPMTPAALKQLDACVVLLCRGVFNDVPLWKQVRTAAAHTQGPNCQTTQYINKAKEKVVVLICI